MKRLQSVQVVSKDQELLCKICKLKKPLYCDICTETFYCKDQYDFHFYTRHDAQ